MNIRCKKTIGRASAVAALCLFSFWTTAQNRILETAPGLATFAYGRDTLDTNAFPSFFRALDYDSIYSVKKTAEVLAHIDHNRSVDKLDWWLMEELQGIGLREYAWFRGWRIECADAKARYMDEGKNRK